MSIKSHRGPRDGVSVMAAALSARVPKKTAGVSPLGGAPQAGTAIPFYHLALGNLLYDTALDKAIRTSWRYPIVGAIKVSLVDIRGDEDQNGATFGGMSYGIAAERFLEAAQLADTQLGADIHEYEPRILDVPALSFMALWLVGSSDSWFISLLEGVPPGSAPLKIEREILRLLRARAASRTGADRALTSPTN